MSFSVSKKGTAGEVVSAIHADTNVPDGAKAFVVDAVNSLAGMGATQQISASVAGHLHNGQDGNGRTSTCTITVEPVAAVAELEQSDAKVASGEQAKEA